MRTPYSRSALSGVMLTASMPGASVVTVGPSGARPKRRPSRSVGARGGDQHPLAGVGGRARQRRRHRRAPDAPLAGDDDQRAIEEWCEERVHASSARASSTIAARSPSSAPEAMVSAGIVAEERHRHADDRQPAHGRRRCAARPGPRARCRRRPPPRARPDRGGPPASARPAPRPRRWPARRRRRRARRRAPAPRRPPRRRSRWRATTAGGARCRARGPTPCDAPAALACASASTSNPLPRRSLSGERKPRIRLSTYPKRVAPIAERDEQEARRRQQAPPGHAAPGQRGERHRERDRRRREVRLDDQRQHRQQRAGDRQAARPGRRGPPRPAAPPRRSGTAPGRPRESPRWTQRRAPAARTPMPGANTASVSASAARKTSGAAAKRRRVPRRASERAQRGAAAEADQLARRRSGRARRPPRRPGARAPPRPSTGRARPGRRPERGEDRG